MKRFISMKNLVLWLLWTVLADFSFAMPKPPSVIQNSSPAVAVFAGGCFWCMEPPFDNADGVIATRSGYTGGETKQPTYRQVSAGATGHFEAIEVTYDPSKIRYEQLLHIFWVNIDPLDNRGQFCDKGKQYRSAIFVANEREKKLAESSLRSMTEMLRQYLKLDSAAPLDIATEILPLQTFYPAEDYHQDYYKKNPIRYKYYRWRCGRDQRLESLWGKRD